MLLIDRKRILNSWPLWLTLLAGVIFITMPMLGWFKLIPGENGDTRLNIYFLEHAYQYLGGKVENYWSAPFMYPEPNIISYSDNLWGTAPVYMLFRLVGFSIYSSFQLWYLSVTILNFLAAWWLFRFLFTNRYAALSGAFIFAFSIALYSQIGHAQVFPRPGIPLAFLFLLKFFQGFKPSQLFLAVFFIVFEIWAGIYLGLLLIVPFLVLFFSLMIVHFSRLKEHIKSSRNWLSYLGGILINLLLLLAVLWPYLLRKNKASDGLYESIKPTSPDINSYFTSHYHWSGLEFLAPDRSTAFTWQQQLFPGFLVLIALILSLFILFYQFRKINFRLKELHPGVWLLVTGFITFFLFLKINDHSAYYYVFKIPGFAAMRSMTRIINVEVLFFGVAIAFAVDAFFKRVNHYQAWFFILIIGLLTLDNSFRETHIGRKPLTDLTDREAGLDSLFTQIPPGSLVSYEPSQVEDPVPFYHLDAMLMAQKYHLITVNAYTATCPMDYSEFWHKITTNGRKFWLGGKDIPFDSIYIIEDKKHLLIKSLKEDLIGYGYAEKAQILTDRKIKEIKQNKEWYQKLEAKAERLQMPIDTLVYKDARWRIEQALKKK